MAFGSNGINPINNNGKSKMIREHLLRNIRGRAVSNPHSIEGVQATLKADSRNILGKNLEVIIVSGKNDFEKVYTEGHHEGFISFMNFLNNNMFNEYVDGIMILNQKMPSGPVYINDMIAINFHTLLNMKDKADLYALKKELSKNLEEKWKKHPLLFSHKEQSVLTKLKYYIRLDELGRTAPGGDLPANPADDGKDGQLDL